MLAEISAAIAAVNGINAAINSLKEAGNNAQDLSAVVGRWADASEKYQAAEEKGAGVMSYQDALRLEQIDRSLKNFDRQLQDICLLQGQGDLYTSIKARIQKSREEHDARVAAIRKKRKERREAIKAASMLFAWGCFGISLIVGVVYLYARFR